jgi:hypothetical protein
VDKAHLESRRAQLEQFLYDVLLRPDLCIKAEVQTFIGITPELVQQLVE